MCCCGQECREHKVRSACREAETCTEAKQCNNYCEDTVKDRIDHIQQRSQEHETEFERLCNTADKCTDSCGCNKTTCYFLLVILRCMDHSQSSARNTEHHTREESGHIHTETPCNVCAGLTCPEVGQIAETDRVKPEYVVQCMVQTCRDQQSVQERIDTCANRSHSYDCLTYSNQCAEYTGHTNRKMPDDEYMDCHTGNDRHTAFAAEERQPIRSVRSI